MVEKVTLSDEVKAAVADVQAQAMDVRCANPRATEIHRGEMMFDPHTGATYTPPNGQCLTPEQGARMGLGPDARIVPDSEGLVPQFNLPNAARGAERLLKGLFGH